MPILSVANIHFDIAGSSRLEYNGGNTINLIANTGGVSFTQNTVEPKQANTLNIGTNTNQTGNIYLGSNRTLDFGGNVKIKNSTVGGESGLQFTGAGEYYQIPGHVYANNILLTMIAPTFQLFTANGTWTKPEGCRKIKVSVIGGGGGGGGTSFSGIGAVGGGGSGGCFSIKWLDVTSWSNSTTVTIGAGGSGGSSSGTNGSAGGTSSFGTHVSCAGGDGGEGMAGGSTNAMAYGGADWTDNMVATGDINVGAGAGEWGGRNTTTGASGLGGADFFGRSAPGGVLGDGLGADGVYGGGGGGASSNSGSGQGGGWGGDGVVLVEEFY